MLRGVSNTLTRAVRENQEVSVGLLHVGSAMGIASFKTNQSHEIRSFEPAPATVLVRHIEETNNLNLTGADRPITSGPPERAHPQRPWISNSSGRLLRGRSERIGHGRGRDTQPGGDGADAEPLSPQFAGLSARKSAQRPSTVHPQALGPGDPRAHIADDHSALSFRKDLQVIEKLLTRPRLRIQIEALVQRDKPDAQPVQPSQVVAQIRQ